MPTTARPEDFASLEKLGIDVKGKVVLARYGEIFRGLKVRNAAEARGGGDLDLFRPGRRRLRPGGRLSRRSLPTRLGGPARERAVPLARPGRPLDARRPLAQGGQAAADRRLERVPDRPTELPGVRSRPGGHGRQGLGEGDRAEARRLLRHHPVAADRYDAARPILEALGGPNVPSGWQGGLPFAYHVGPGPAEVEFSVAMDYQVRTIWNVIATIPGEVEPDRWVMIGNHRDAWVYGAVDPGSGTAATLEMCRALGVGGQARLEAAADARLRELGRRGVRPGRLDRVGRGPRPRDRREGRADAQRRLGGRRPRPRHRRRPVAPRPAARRRSAPSTDVRSGRTLRQSWIDAAPRALGQPTPPSTCPTRPRLAANSHASRTPPRFSPQMDSLGSGSDYTAFLDHLGDPGARRRLQRAVRGLPLDLRRLHLDGAVRRPRVPHPHDGRAALHA